MTASWRSARTTTTCPREGRSSREAQLLELGERPVGGIGLGTAPRGTARPPLLLLFAAPLPAAEGDAVLAENGAIAQCRQHRGEILDGTTGERRKRRRRRERPLPRQPPRLRRQALDAIDAQDTRAEHAISD